MAVPPSVRAERLAPTFAARLIRTGITIGVVDALWAFVLTAAYGRPLFSVWRGVAAVPFGKEMLDGGVRAGAIGLGLHFCVAFTWSAVWLIAHVNSAALRRLTSTAAGVAAASVLYGPFIWCVMSLVVTPSFTHNAPVITARWVIQLCGHMVFVGLPIVWSVARGGTATTS